MTRASKALLIFFWVAFAAFLSASIPHVAWFFSVFEPVNGPQGPLYWAVSYGIAISIDVTVFLLSMTVAGMAKQGKKKSLIASVWLFILALAALSWFINGKYAIHFEQGGVIAPSPVTLSFFGWGNWHISDINPLLASCFQVLAVAYTWIADKIAAGEKPKTAAELKAEADELEAASVQKARIAAAKRENLDSSLTGAMELGSTLLRKAKVSFGRVKPANEETSEETNEEQSTEVNTDAFAALNLQSMASEQGQEISNQSSQDGRETSQEITDQYPALVGLSGRATLPIEQVAQMIGCEIKYVQSLRSKGTLKHAAKSKDAITVASLKTYLATRRKPRQSPSVEQRKDVSMPASSSNLGMVETMMLDAIQRASKEDQEELHQLASEKSLNELTAILQSRYPQYASYITGPRVERVMDAMGVVRKPALHLVNS